MVYLLFIVFWIDLWDYPNETRIMVDILKRVYLLNFSSRYNIIFRSLSRSWKWTTLFVFKFWAENCFLRVSDSFREIITKIDFVGPTGKIVSSPDGYQICTSNIIILNASKTNFHSEFQKKNCLYVCHLFPQHMKLSFVFFLDKQK